MLTAFSKFAKELNVFGFFLGKAQESLRGFKVFAADRLHVVDD